MNKKVSRFVILPLAMLMLASCGPATATSSAGASVTESSAADSGILPGKVVTFSSKATSWDSVSYTFEVISEGTVVYQKAELVDDANKVVATDDGCKAKAFTGLLADTSYIFNGYYSLNGTAMTHIGAAKTRAVITPTITTKNDTVTATSIAGDIVVTDADGVYTFETVKLFLKADGATALATSADPAKFNFTGLTAGTAYQLYLGFKVDKKDGTGTFIERDYFEDFTTKAA